MNPIIRNIIRGLVSGEIKPEPHVFEYLRGLSERQLKRHSRILRFVEPSTQGVPLTGRHASDGRLPDKHQSTRRRDRSTECSSGSTGISPTRRGWFTFANVSHGHLIRVAGCLLVVCAVVGIANAQASLAGAKDHMETAGQAYSDGISMPIIGVLGVLQPIPHAALIASGMLLASLLVGAGWQWFCRNKLFVMKPYEVALQKLESTRYRSEQGKVADPRRVVLDILQDYVEAQFGWRLPELGRDSAFRSFAQGGALLTDDQRLLLWKVLETSVDASDLSHQGCADLSEKAARFIWATACIRAPKGTLLRLAGGCGATHHPAVGH